MALDFVTSLPTPGFKFDNCMRNSFLTSKGFATPKARKTGTTIAGFIFEDGVILGADTRATVGSIVADKACKKIHYIAKNMYCCGAGTAADTEQVTNMVASQMELHRLATDRKVPVAVAERITSQHLFRYQGHVSAALILGGVDLTGPSVFTIAPHGSTEKMPFAAMGSGSLAAISVLEKGYKPGLSLEEGKKLMCEVICAGIFNDLGSGSQVDLCIITKEGAKLIEHYAVVNAKGVMQGKYEYPKGTTAVLTSKTVPLDVVQTIVKVHDDAMDTGES